MTKAEWAALNRKLQFRAFTMAKLGTATEIETAKQILADAVEKGETYAESWQTLKDSLGGNPSFKPGYWETVFRTNTQSAYMAGKLEKYADTGAVAYQLLVIEDERTSKICRHLLVESGYGAILPVGHRFWQKYGFPPYHFNCRTSVCPIYSSQVAKTGYIVEDIPMNRFAKFKPQKGFGGNPLDRGNWWDMTDSMKKQAVKFGLMNEFDKTKRILGVSGNQKTADSKNVKMDKDKILIEKVGDEIAGVKKEEPMTFEKADSGNVNPDFKEDSPTSRNCSICVTSFKARLDGFNVKAKPDDEENLLMLALSEKTNIAFIDKNTGTFPEYLKPKENYMPRLLSWFDNNLEDKKYYSIEFYWKNSYEGHILIIFKNKGIVTLYDPQDNSTYINKRLETELYKVRRSSIKLINISDCFLNKTVVDSILEARK